ncbi:transcription-repair coupling factor [Chamaesiphon sp.]|uniref:transcription-repair coupling factor n=1 Tax=Chamaesiphon sp. TaxID=2814140 RepID=UPI00359408D2
MAFSALIRTLERSQLAAELLSKLQQQGMLHLSGLPRLPKGLVASALAQGMQQHLVVVTATVEEGGRWAAQLEAMDWKTVHFYPTTESSPYKDASLESEMIWGQMQGLADIRSFSARQGDGETEGRGDRRMAIVCTTLAFQPHLPSPAEFDERCLTLRVGDEGDVEKLGTQLVYLGYERVPLVEVEGQWSRRGDIIDIFPVAAELPVRLEWFGDELDKLREFDPSTQRSLDKVENLTLTPVNFGTIFGEDNSQARYSLIDYLPDNCLVVVDEFDRAQAHNDRWWEYMQEEWETLPAGTPIRHQQFDASMTKIRDRFAYLRLDELAVSGEGLNLACRSIPTIPHQFAKIADTLRGYHKQSYSSWLVSAQPSRSASLLQEHDCPAQFVPNPRDFPAIDKLQIQHTTVAIKYSGIAELEGFILPTFRMVLVTDREFFGQQSLASFGYTRKRRQAVSKQVDPNKLRPGDYVVHRNHGLGRFIKFESIQTDDIIRDYLTIQYADGSLKVAADQVGVLSRFRQAAGAKPELNKLSGQAWEKTKAKVKKSIKKLAFDLLKLYAERSQKEGFSFPPDAPWQQELEDSFRYQPTPDQLKSTQDVKRDMESDRPMDRLVCGDVGFGKTEVAIRAIFKAVTANKQVIFLAPTTILTQQHYHTLKERFAPYPINVGLLNRFRTAEERKDILARLKTGELDIVIGTHQLLSKELKFKDLGLLVIDEEQRFGVNQKEKIKTLKSQIDVLTLSATPIPRTLYMSLSGVREMSLITTPPPSRRPIDTHLSPYKIEAVETAIRQELDRGGQIFYVVPRIEGIEETAAKIHEVIPSCRIAIAHGQMDESELESTMLTFSNGDADLLVCTTIIESGLDIPRVNTILVEDAHRFGLSQLYQLRGRVGRAGIQAHAWLFFPKETTLTETARQRLKAIQEFTQLGSGYQLATRDMEIRGVGNLLGAEQSGQMDVIGFDLYMEMLQEAIKEIRGQEIPQVDDTQIDLKVTAMIPADYISDLEQKMSAYRSVAAADTKQELTNIAAEWHDRYGEIPKPAAQLFRIVELKQIAKQLGFSRIRPDGKQHVILETPMAEPAWNLLAEYLTDSSRSRYVYSTGKVTARGLGVLRPNEQVETLINTLNKMQGVLMASSSST